MAMWLCACSPFKNVVMSRIHPESSWKWYNKHNIWKQPRYYFFFFPLQIFSFVILFFFVESNAANQCWKMNIKDKIKMGYTCCSPSQKQSWTDMRKFCRKTNWEFYNSYSLHSHILPIRRRNFVRNLKVGLETISTSGGQRGWWINAENGENLYTTHPPLNSKHPSTHCPNSWTSETKPQGIFLFFLYVHDKTDQGMRL